MILNNLSEEFGKPESLESWDIPNRLDTRCRPKGTKQRKQILKVEIKSGEKRKQHKYKHKHIYKSLLL